MPSFRAGTDDFKKLRDQGGYFVDKSPLIRSVLASSEVTLIPRPRRFGKTLSMTMLRYFFEKSAEDRRPLFDGLAIRGPSPYGRLKSVLLDDTCALWSCISRGNRDGKLLAA